MRSLTLSFSLFLAACGVDHSDSVPADTGADESSSGGTYGTLPGNDEDDTTTDTEDTDSEDTDTVDTDVEDTDTAVVVDQTVEATLYIWPDAQWEDSLDTAGYPTTCLYNTANVTTGDWSSYGSTCVDTDSSHTSLTDAISYVPGQLLATNVSWNDGTTNRNVAGAGNTVLVQTQDWPDFGDTTDQVVAIQFADGSYDLYQVDSTGTSTGTGNAYFFASSWVGDDGVTYYGYDIYINTYGDDVGAFGG